MMRTTTNIQADCDDADAGDVDADLDDDDDDDDLPRNHHPRYLHQNHSSTCRSIANPARMKQFCLHGGGGVIKSLGWPLRKVWKR